MKLLFYYSNNDDYARRRLFYSLLSLCIPLLLILSTLFAAEISLSGNVKYFLPIGNNRAIEYNTLKNKVIGAYGEHRNSKIRGHKHAGIDIQGNYGEMVYAIGKGTVTDIFRDFPHKTIYIRHNENGGPPFYSVYIHVEDIQVNRGDVVTENTPIARIFTREELQSAHFGTAPHLHFEIRHNINDKGDATFKSMSISELNKYCSDPLLFFKTLSEH
ncbi:MAG: M23 family metallopeptidase [bacterium]